MFNYYKLFNKRNIKINDYKSIIILEMFNYICIK